MSFRCRSSIGLRQRRKPATRVTSGWRGEPGPQSLGDPRGGRWHVRVDLQCGGDCSECGLVLVERLWVVAQFSGPPLRSPVFLTQLALGGPLIGSAFPFEVFQLSSPDRVVKSCPREGGSKHRHPVRARCAVVCVRRLGRCGCYPDDCFGDAYRDARSVARCPLPAARARSWSSSVPLPRMPTRMPRR
jgi:hypothetical protein